MKRGYLGLLYALFLCMGIYLYIANLYIYQNERIIDRTIAINRINTTKHYTRLQDAHVEKQQFIQWIPYVSNHTYKHLYEIPSSFHNLTTNITTEFYILKQQLTEISKKIKSQTCKRYFSYPMRKRLFIPKFYGHCYGFGDNNITLALQMDNHIEYLQKLTHTLANWDGPISVAIYFKMALSKKIGFYLSYLKNVIVDTKLEHIPICWHIVVGVTKTTEFPINTLRNIAVKHAQTDNVLLLEADFLIPKGIVPKIQKHMKRSYSMKNHVMVIPLFGAGINESFKMPNSKKDVITLWKKHLLLPIHELPKSYKQGHEPTMYRIFKRSRRPYEVQYKNGYEPYYLVNRKYVPFYPEEFRYGFRDKGAHALILSKLRFKFIVLPDVFIVNTPHTHKHTKRYSTHFKCAKIAVANLNRTIEDDERLLSNK